MNQLAFIPLRTQHFPLLNRWLQEPHVWQWREEGKRGALFDIEAIGTADLQGYKNEEGQKPIYPFIIEWDGHPIGYIQYYNAFDFKQENVEEMGREVPSLARLDFYLGESSFLGRGIDGEIVQKFLAEYVFCHFDACFVDLDKNDKWVIKAYAKAGFLTYQETSSSILMIAKKQQEKNPIVIFGSSRSQGQTLQAIQAVIHNRDIPLIDLRELNISYYDYHNSNHLDDFIPLAERMVKHNPIILATPVYWYTMSAIMKTFMDRWSDLLDSRKDLGRRLAGKELYVIASYAGEIPKGFEEAFLQTCHYLEMKYKGCFYFYSGEDLEKRACNIPAAKVFSAAVLNEV